MENKEQYNNDFYLTQWLDGKLSDDELNKYVSEEDVIAYKKLKQGIRLYENLEKPLDTSFLRIKNKIEKKTKVRRLYKQAMLSAAATIAIFFAVFSVISTNDVINSTDYAEQKTIYLLDGSEVILNAKSELTYDKKTWKSNREVYLNGEAFFKVEKGSQFTVKTDNGSVSVLGTQFNVISYDDYFEVNCYEGRVSVNINNEKRILLPNQATRKVNGNSQENWTLELSNPTWISGESTFRSVPLRYVITALERQYNVRFDKSKIDDSQIFTGSFTHSNLKTALTTVLKTMQIQYKKNDKIIELGSMHK